MKLEGKKTMDKIDRILDIIDEHLEEENCRHSFEEVFREKWLY